MDKFINKKAFFISFPLTLINLLSQDTIRQLQSQINNVATEIKYLYLSCRLFIPFGILQNII